MGTPCLIDISYRGVSVERCLLLPSIFLAASSRLLQIFLGSPFKSNRHTPAVIHRWSEGQFCLCHSHIQCILNPGAVNGNFSPILESQLHTPGVHVEFAGSFIVFHNRILQILLLAYGLRQGIGGLRRPREPSLLYPKKTKNPNPSPIGNRFGFFLFGGRGWIRTTEAESSRFTVCPHWPLGNTPIFFCVRRADCLYILPRAKQFVNHLQQILSQFLHQSLQQTRPMEKPPGNQCSRAVFLGAGDRS